MSDYRKAWVEDAVAKLHGLRNGDGDDSPSISTVNNALWFIEEFAHPWPVEIRRLLVGLELRFEFCGRHVEITMLDWQRSLICKFSRGKVEEKAAWNVDHDQLRGAARAITRHLETAGWCSMSDDEYAMYAKIKQAKGA